MCDTILETPRLLLRRWRPEDLAPFARMNADPVCSAVRSSCKLRLPQNQTICSLRSDYNGKQTRSFFKRLYPLYY